MNPLLLEQRKLFCFHIYNYSNKKIFSYFTNNFFYNKLVDIRENDVLNKEKKILI